MLIVKSFILKCIWTVWRYSTRQNYVTVQKNVILLCTDMRTSDLDIILILVRLILFTDDMK
jgi:hypothetical protein